MISYNLLHIKNQGLPKIHFSHLLGSQFPSSNPSNFFPDPWGPITATSFPWSTSVVTFLTKWEKWVKSRRPREVFHRCQVNFSINEDWWRLSTSDMITKKQRKAQLHDYWWKTIIAYIVTLFLKVASQQHLYMHILLASNYFKQKAVQTQNHRLQMGFGKSMIHTNDHNFLRLSSKRMYKATNQVSKETKHVAAVKVEAPILILSYIWNP